MSDTKTALVTGAGARIGQALAIRLGQMGFAVAVHYRHSRAGADQTVATICEQGGRAKALKADLCDETELADLIARAEAAFLSPVRVLVNNAAGFAPDTALQCSPAQWEAHMALNLYAPIALSRHFAQALPAPQTGHIIHILDQRVHQPDPTYFSYSLSKSALWAATQMLAQTLAPNIRVNAIGPGAILAATHESEAEFSQISQDRLVRAEPGLEDMADALAYLIEAQSVTGQMLTIDSGLHLNNRLALATPDKAREASPPTLPDMTRRSLTLDALEVAAEIGVYPSELGQTQPLICALQIELAPALEPQSLSDTTDYAQICQTAQTIAKARHFPLLENFADALADALIDLPHVQAVRLHVCKPKAQDYIGAKPGIIVHRLA